MRNGIRDEGICLKVQSCKGSKVQRLNLLNIDLYNSDFCYFSNNCIENHIPLKQKSNPSL